MGAELIFSNFVIFEEFPTTLQIVENSRNMEGVKTREVPYSTTFSTQKNASGKCSF